MFQPNTSEVRDYDLNIINKSLIPLYQLKLPMDKITTREIMKTIKILNPKKSVRYNLITTKIFLEILAKTFKLVTLICNAIWITEYFPIYWKVTHIILIPKPGKPIEYITSCILISYSQYYQNCLRKC